LLSDIAELCKIDIVPVIVHGGGPQIAKMLKTLNVESSFVDGLRVTDEV
jgi:acetylglutamate kinase